MSNLTFWIRKDTWDTLMDYSDRLPISGVEIIVAKSSDIIKRPLRVGDQPLLELKINPLDCDDVEKMECLICMHAECTCEPNLRIPK